MHGYTGRLLEVDLTSGSIQVRPLPLDWARDYLGGRGLGARLLFELLAPGADALSPDNVALLMAGPFTGTEIYSCQKYEWVTKSPLTGTYLCSSCGGLLGVALRRAGYDGLIISGASLQPVWLWVSPGHAQLLPADEFWGRSVSQTQAALRRRVDPSAAVGCIGPAAEPPQQVRFAGFFDGQRSAGRGGLGAVLGSKRLKALVVTPGSIEVAIHNPQSLALLLPELARALKRDRVTGDALPSVGSMLWLDALASLGYLPTRNYQQGISYDELRGRLDSATFSTHFAEPTTGRSQLGPANCHRCPLESAKMCTPDQGVLRGQQIRGPEFQSAWALGVNCGILDYRAIISGYASCNDLGVDALSMGGVIGFAMECWQHGLLDRDRVARDYDGLRLEWGNCGALLHTIDIVAGRQGWLGELLADGVRAAAERLPGSATFAMHVKGMELPAYDPRACWSMALAYATSCRGACHLKSYALDVELGTGPAAGATGPARAALVVQAENRRAVADSALVCSFAGSALTHEWLVSLLRVVTGRDLGGLEVERGGARVCDLERVLALRQGISAADDRLPDRLFDEPIRGGECDGARLDRADFGRLLGDYYALRGWSATGVPPVEAAQLGEWRLASS